MLIGLGSVQLLIFTNLVDCQSSFQVMKHIEGTRLEKSETEYFSKRVLCLFLLLESS